MTLIEIVAVGWFVVAVVDDNLCQKKIANTTQYLIVLPIYNYHYHISLFVLNVIIIINRIGCFKKYFCFCFIYININIIIID